MHTSLLQVTRSSEQGLVLYSVHRQVFGVTADEEESVTRKWNLPSGAMWWRVKDNKPLTSLTNREHSLGSTTMTRG